MKPLIYDLALLLAVALASGSACFLWGYLRGYAALHHQRHAFEHPDHLADIEPGIFQGDGGAPEDVDLLRQFLPSSGLRTFDIQAFTSDILEEPVNVACLDCQWIGPGHELVGIPFTSYDGFELTPAHQCPGCKSSHLVYSNEPGPEDNTF